MFISLSYCAWHIWFDFDFDLLRDLVVTGSSFQASCLFPRAPLSTLSTLMILHKQNDCPRSEDKEGGIQVAASSLPFQNSFLAGRGGCCARGCCLIGCRNSFDVRGAGGLVHLRRWSSYRRTRRQDVGNGQSWLLLHHLVNIRCRRCRAERRSERRQSSPFRPLAELSRSFAVDLFEPIHEVRDVFFKTELTHLGAVS